ncbi:MAG: helix-hairpin-helix domain-containing protein [Bacteroidota bacterium]
MGNITEILTENTFLYWWLINMIFPLLVGLFLGYLIWGHHKRKSDKIKQELEEEKALRAKAEKELTDDRSKITQLKYQLGEAEKDNRALRSSLRSTEADLVLLKSQMAEVNTESTEETDALVASESPKNTDDDGEGGYNYASVFLPTDLRMIEGIDPSIESILRNSGINDWGALASKSPEEVKAILAAAGPEYADLEPESWIQQAKLAAQGKWDELIALQRVLGDDGVAKANLYYGVRAKRDTNFDDYNRLLSTDNLQVIEGVGAKSEAALKAGGVNNWSDVAGKTPEELKTILLDQSKNFRVLNTDSWPQQATYATQGQWKELIDMQKFLDAGRDNTGDFDTPSKVDMIVAKLRDGAGPENRDTSINYSSIYANDNLQIIEGIGPKLEEVLKSGGINSWADMSAKTPEELSEIIVAANKRNKMHNTSSWPKQAQLAAQGKWDELIAYQRFLGAAGAEASGKENPSKVLKMAMTILGFSNNPEDLTIVEGIGPKIDGLMKAAGINTWSDLAATSVSKLKEILREAGDKYKLAVPDTWPKQAKLAAEGKWSELKDYQDFLDGGREPVQS